MLTIRDPGSHLKANRTQPWSSPSYLAENLDLTSGQSRSVKHRALLGQLRSLPLRWAHRTLSGYMQPLPFCAHSLQLALTGSWDRSITAATAPQVLGLSLRHPADQTPCRTSGNRQLWMAESGSPPAPQCHSSAG